jgi:hypothetical protein
VTVRRPGTVTDSEADGQPSVTGPTSKRGSGGGLSGNSGKLECLSCLPGARPGAQRACRHGCRGTVGHHVMGPAGARAGPGAGPPGSYRDRKYCFS